MAKIGNLRIGFWLAILLVALVVAYFEPWRLFTQSTVEESLPEKTVSSPQGLESSNVEADVLLTGKLISHEHQTSGSVKVLQLEDGSRILRIEGLQTSDGPDLEVWLSDAQVVEGYEGWFLADDGEHVSLGKLKATRGDQNYEIPPEVDFSQFSSMSIWCVRFAVSFGAAQLD